jgi:hypothetical protein
MRNYEPFARLFPTWTALPLRQSVLVVATECGDEGDVAFNHPYCQLFVKVDAMLN